MHTSGFMLVLSVACKPVVNDIGELRHEDVVAPDPEDSGVDTDTADANEESDSGTEIDTPFGFVCYPGVDELWNTCLPLVQLDPVPSDYQYPAPYGGSEQYREPIAYLDLDAVDSDTWLAPNFQLFEVASEWKGRWAVVQHHAIERAQALRDELGPLTVNSGYRSPAYNAEVGGVSSSRHQFGDAFDLGSAEASLDDLAQACEDNGAAYVGWYEAHIHCDWRDELVDSEFYGAADAKAAVAQPAPHAEMQRTMDGSWRTSTHGWDEGEPLREWTAFDSGGALVAEAIGRRFAPPPAATKVCVNVGRAIRTCRPTK